MKSNKFQVYLTEILFKLKKLSSRRNTDLRDSIEACLKSLKNDTQLTIVLSKELLMPFQFACDSRLEPLMSEALDGLQLLTSISDFSNYDMKHLYSKEIKSDESIIVNILTIICSCSLFPSDAILIKVVRNILIAVYSSHSIHGEFLIMILRTIFHIHLTSKSNKTKLCCQATLANITQIYFERAQRFSEIFFKLIDKLHDKKSNRDILKMIKQKMFKFEEERVMGVKNLDENKIVCRQIFIEILIKNVFDVKPGKYGFCKICYNPSDHFCIHTKETVCSNICKMKNILGQNEIRNLKSIGNEINTITVLTFLYRNDCLSSFSALCNLSINNRDSSFEHGSKFSEKTLVILESKSLAINILLHILKGDIVWVKKSKNFVTIIRKELLKAVLENLFMQYDTSKEIAIEIFLQLIQDFKSDLKNEIGFFLDQVFVKIIESKNSSYSQKYACTMAYLKICSNDQTLVDIFLNYDCNSENCKVFKNMIAFVDRITQLELVLKDWIKPEQEISLKLVALKCLKQLFASLENRAERAICNIESGNKKDIRTEDEFVSMFKKRKEKEAIHQRASNKFNSSTKIAISMLKSFGFLGANESLSIAKFLFKNKKINKMVLGRYLGEASSKNILSEYVHLFDFSGMEIDLAMRKMLNHFLLIGESQAIDRITCEFAAKYCFDNPKVFSNSDSAHILAFSIIMLNTDLHSAQVTNKMSKSAFVRNNKSLCSSDNITVSFLESIYERILKEEIKFENCQNTCKDYIDPITRKKLFEKESKNIKEQTLDALSSFNDNKEEYIHADENNLRILYAMLDTVWSSSLASISILLEKNEDKLIISACLDIYTHAIRLATLFKMDIIKEAFVNTLARMTLLGTNQKLRAKNVSAIQALLEIAYKEGNSLDKAWLVVLRCISQLEYLHRLGSGQKPDYLHFKPKINTTDDYFDRIGPILRDKEYEQKKILKGNDSIVAGLVKKQYIDQIFTNSEFLSDKKIKVFFKFLCNIALDELIDRKQPRLLCLNKIVETASYQLERSVDTWHSIWKHLNSLFIQTSVIKNSNILEYVINSYRLLIKLFLRKKKFSHDGDFQKIILTALEIIMRSTSNPRLREILLQTIFKTVESSSTYLRTGWVAILRVVSIGASDSNEDIVDYSLNCFSFILHRLGCSLMYFEKALSEILIFFRNIQKNNFYSLKQRALGNEFYVIVGLLQQREESELYHKNLKCAIYNLLIILFSMNTLQPEKFKTLKFMDDMLQKLTHEKLSSSVWNSIFRKCIFSFLKHIISHSALEKDEITVEKSKKEIKKILMKKKIQEKVLIQNEEKKIEYDFLCDFDIEVTIGKIIELLTRHVIQKKLSTLVEELNEIIFMAAKMKNTLNKEMIENLIELIKGFKKDEYIVNKTFIILNDVFKYSIMVRIRKPQISSKILVSEYSKEMKTNKHYIKKNFFTIVKIFEIFSIFIKLQTSDKSEIFQSLSRKNYEELLNIFSVSEVIFKRWINSNLFEKCLDKSEYLAHLENNFNLARTIKKKLCVMEKLKSITQKIQPDFKKYMMMEKNEKINRKRSNKGKPNLFDIKKQIQCEKKSNGIQKNVVSEKNESSKI